MAILAPSLRRLRDDYINVRWPDRDRSSDGWIGDSSHRASGSPEQGGSDHNPNARDTVDAIDVDRNGVSAALVIASALRSPAVHYVIFNRRIMDADNQHRPRAYRGINPHTGHIHISLRQSRIAELWKGAWKFILKPLSTVMLQKGNKGETVKDLQALLIGYGANIAIDGDFGDHTHAAVIGFQKAHDLLADGIVGAKTRAKLRP